MEKILLSLLDAFAWLFRSLGADYEQVRAIVGVKLLMDSRRHLVGIQRKPGSEGNTFLKTMLVYAVLGALVGFMIAFIPSFRFAMTVFFSYLMVMVVMTLITDFSSILLDASDNTIILPRPVDGRTLFVARSTHILLYLGQLALGLSVVPCAVVLSQYGLAVFAAFVAGIALAVVIAVFITHAFYLLVMQFSSEEKLKNIINYFQIGMAIVVMASYQIVPRAMNRFIHVVDFDLGAWSFAAPPLWIVGGLEIVQGRTIDILHIGLTSVALVAPVAGIYVVNTFLAPMFNRKLSALGDSAGKENLRKTAKEKTSIPGKRWFTTSPVEQGAFDVVSKLLSRDRKIKLKIYPAYGYMLVMAFVFLFRNNGFTLGEVSGSRYYLLLIYLMFVVQQVALREIPYSDDFKASWIYFSAPLAAPGEILSGMLKAIFVRLFLPGYAVLCAMVLYFWGVEVWPNLLFGLFNNMIMMLLMVIIGDRHLPFSIQPNLRAQSGNVARGLLTGLIIAILALVHYGLGMMPAWWLWAAIPAQLVVLYFAYRDYRQTTWEQLTL